MMFQLGAMGPLFLLFFASSSLQVDVEFLYFGGRIELCHNLLPGECCIGLNPGGYPDASEFSRYHGNPEILRYYPLVVRVKKLFLYEIAAVWGAIDVGAQSVDIRAQCDGAPKRTLAGPGDFQINAWDSHFAELDDAPEHVFSGVSYIRLPTNVPPDKKTSLWLAAEGMLGLAWGGGKWLSRGARTLNLPLDSNSNMKRGMKSNLQGTAYAGPPPLWRYPDVIRVNGTDYHSMNVSALYYQSTDGQTLNLTNQTGIKRPVP